MKPVLAWVKKHVVVVICAALTLIILPVTFVLSSGWGKSVRESAQKKAADELKKVESTKVAYGLPSVLPNVEAVSLNTEPNTKLTEFFKAQREKILSEAGTISARALEINRREPLITGLFPKAASADEAQSKGLEFADILVGGPRRPSAYQQLFAAVRAGEVADPAVVGQMITDAREREMERLKAGRPDRVPTPEENEEIKKRLVDIRQSEYRKRAAELSVYGSVAVLPKESILTAMPTQPPPAWQAFRWQWDYWVYQDLLNAIARANGADRGQLGVDRSVVKRIIAMGISDRRMASLSEPGEGRRGDPNAAPPPPGDPNAIKQAVQLSPGYSVTGRAPGAANQVFDVRMADVVLVVSASRLPELFDALAATNFMTVVDLDLTAVDPWKDLEQGYYYGDEPVVQAQLRIETIWLRQWTAPLMPQRVREALGVAWTEPAPPPAEGQPAPGPG